jgi:hypothetical protein
MEALAPTGTVTMTPAELSQMPANADAIVILNALGISTNHQLTLDYYPADGSGPRLIYSVFPESGPTRGINEWAHKVRDFPVWQLPVYDGRDRASQLEGMRVQAAACQYVLDAACNEVAAESELGEGWRTA